MALAAGGAVLRVDTGRGGNAGVRAHEERAQLDPDPEAILLPIGCSAKIEKAADETWPHDDKCGVVAAEFHSTARVYG